MAQTRVVLTLMLDHDDGAPLAALVAHLEGESLRDPETQRRLGVIDSATITEAEVAR